METLTINVSGKTNTGKSRLTFLLKKFLRENGFEVEFNCGTDFADESQFDTKMNKDFDQVIEHIKKTKKIHLAD